MARVKARVLYIYILIAAGRRFGLWNIRIVKLFFALVVSCSGSSVQVHAVRFATGRFSRRRAPRCCVLIEAQGQG